MRKLPLADQLRVASSCESDQGTPFCTSCQKIVHDIALLTRDEVRALLRSRSERDGLCVRTLRRKSDGAVLLADGFALPSTALAPKRFTAAVAAMSAAAVAGCTSPPPVVRAPPNVASPAIGWVWSEETAGERAPRGPVAPPLPDPPPPPNEAWLEEQALELRAGETAMQRKIRALANREVHADVGSVVVVTAIPPYWPSWP